MEGEQLDFEAFKSDLLSLQKEFEPFNQHGDQVQRSWEISKESTANDVPLFNQSNPRMQDERCDSLDKTMRSIDISDITKEQQPVGQSHLQPLTQDFEGRTSCIDHKVLGNLLETGEP